MSADPAGPVDGLNLYVYVSNNPVRKVDPEGTTEASADSDLDGDAWITDDPVEQIEAEPYYDPHLTQKLMDMTPGSKESIGRGLGIMSLWTDEEISNVKETYGNYIPSAQKDLLSAFEYLRMQNAFAEARQWASQEIIANLPGGSTYQGPRGGYADAKDAAAMEIKLQIGSMIQSGVFSSLAYAAAQGVSDDVEVQSAMTSLGQIVDAGTMFRGLAAMNPGPQVQGLRLGENIEGFNLSLRAPEKTVSVFHGSIKDGSKILRGGLDPARGTAFVSRDIAAAKDALKNHPGAIPGKGTIIESRIPELQFKSALAPMERPYSGFYPYGLQSTEITLRTPEQFQLFNQFMVKP